MERYRPCRRARPRPQQLDLFGPEDPKPAPIWTGFPAATRRTLTDLVTRMLLDNARPAEREGAADDA
jgi:hypothetical protein